MPTATEYLALAQSLFAEHGRPEVAEGQMKYMRNQFEFYGLKAPVWLGLSKNLFKTHGYLSGKALHEFVQKCYEEEHRELQYLATEMVQRTLKKQGEAFIARLEWMVLHKSWWDTVDWIAKLIGIHFKRYPRLIRPQTLAWMDSDNIWLQRCCLIFQLFYKADTDTGLLFECILRLKDSSEFFIQKAIGWSLRQHSKTEPELVLSFISSHDLAPLSHREGLKWLKKQGHM